MPHAVSYSALHTFDRCPQRFYITHVLGMRPLPRDGGRALAIGSAVHLALQTADPVKSATDVAERLGLDEAGTRRVERAAAAFAQSGLAADLADADELHVEWPLAIALGPSRLVGSMDVMARTGEQVLIVDYKTGQDIEASRSEERMSGYELQARCYALAALVAGAKTVRVVFAFVEQDMSTVEFDFAEGDEDEICTQLNERLDRMESGEFPHLDAYDEATCAGCVALGGLCPMDRP